MEGAMWLVALVITATVSGESQEANSSSYLDAAMTGFDPFYMSGLKEPNPGRRAKIFQPLYTLNYHPNKTVLNSFVNEEQNRNYVPEITVDKIVNFHQYLEFTASSAYEFSSNTDCSASFIRHVNYSSCKTKNHERDRAMLQFFRNTRGKVLFAKTDIVTHTITILPFEITTFTDAFQRAVETLYRAAVNPSPEVGEQIFNEFTRLYGTHFSRRTLLGSRAIFGKLFSTGAVTDEEETDRRQCVLEAAREALTPCVRGCNETTQTVFERASSNRCGGEEHEAIVAVSGPLPERSLDDWSSSAKDSPNPIFYELEPLSSLFATEWFEDYFDRIQVRINGTKLSQYYEEKQLNNSRRMTRERLDSPLPRGCGLSSDCRRGTECHNEPNTESGFSCVLREEEATTTTTSTTARTTTKIPTTTTPVPTTTTTTRPACPACPTSAGPVLMMGGYNARSGTSSYLSNGDAIDTWILPNLTYAAYGGTLAAVGSKIYSCGGYRSGTGATSSCYVLDRTSQSPRWDSTASLPTPMHYHTSATIADHIWTVHGGKLYDLNTKENKFRTFHLPLTVLSGHCAVSNGSHSFIIGAGASYNEIWVNTEAYNPAKWHRVGHLRASRRHFGCVLFEQEVFITGGESSRTDAVVFDTVTHALRSAGALVQGRQRHRMMVFEGKPAVVGGYSGSATLASIETYDQRTSLWTTSRRSLAEVRRSFGLVQLRG